MFLKNCWYVGAFPDEIGEKPLGRTLLGEPVVLFRQFDGTPVALQDRCCHRGLPLVHGTVIAEGIRCGYHGLVYDRTGRCIRVPGQDTVPSKARVPSYPVVEQDALIWIWLGDPARADPAEIVRYPWHHDPAWGFRGKRTWVDARYDMILDNLLDLTHVGYVHASTIGGDPDAHSNAEMTSERSSDGVRVVRWLRNSLPPPTYVAAAGFAGRVDRWTEIEFKPGVLTIHAGAKDVGTGAYEGRREGGFALRSLHGVTPETENSAHYFWTIGHRLRADMPDLTERVYREIDAAFAEDKVIIEAQAARVLQKPLPPLLDIRTDLPVVQARRIIASRMELEERLASPVAASHHPAVAA